MIPEALAGPSVYELLPMLDDSRFEGFGTKRARSFLGNVTLGQDFALRVSGPGNWKVSHLTPLWEPVEAICSDPTKIGDYATIGFLIPVFSERAVHTLSDVLTKNGEVLPLKTKLTKRYFAYNTTTVVDAVDRDASIIVWSGKDRLMMRKSVNYVPFRAEKLRYLVFRSEALVGLMIFRIPEAGFGLYVTQGFVDIVTSHDLQGFNFRKISPLPAPPNGSVQEAERRAGLKEGG